MIQPSYDKEDKYRYFAFFVYETYKDGKVQITRDELIRVLIQSFAEFAVSPTHQPDEEMPQGNHWHVIYKHPSSVRWQAVHKFLNGIEGLPIFNGVVICLHHPKVYMRYLLHLDNPEKEQFVGGESLIECVNGFPLDLSRELTDRQKIEIQMEIESFAYEFNIHEYASMTKYLADEGMFEHYRYFTTHTHHFGKFLDSLRYMSSESKEADINA